MGSSRVQEGFKKGSRRVQEGQEWVQVGFTRDQEGFK